MFSINTYETAVYIIYVYVYLYVDFQKMGTAHTFAQDVGCHKFHPHSRMTALLLKQVRWDHQQDGGSY